MTVECKLQLLQHNDTTANIIADIDWFISWFIRMQFVFLSVFMFQQFFQHLYNLWESAKVIHILKPGSSECAPLVHLVYLTITYQLVKLFGAALKKAAKNRVERRYMKLGYFRNRDVVQIGMEVVRLSLRLEYLQPSAGK